MPKIVRGQRVRTDKVELAKHLRREMTPSEKTLWAHLRKGALGVHFRRQQIIDGFIVDFYCHSARVVVEVDGPVHLQQVDYDRARDLTLASQNLVILRFTNEQVSENLEDVLHEIEQTCHSRISPLLPPQATGPSAS